MKREKLIFWRGKTVILYITRSRRAVLLQMKLILQLSMQKLLVQVISMNIKQIKKPGFVREKC